MLPDGRIAYEVKYLSRRATHRVMTMVEFLARLAALVPPPQYPLVRYAVSIMECWRRIRAGAVLSCRIHVHAQRR